MNLARKAVARLLENVREEGVRGLQTTLYQYYVSGIRYSDVGRLFDSTNVYEKDWDVLVLLDCTRPEFVSTVADEYEFLDSQGTLSSVGTSSIEWLQKTFVDRYTDEMANTAYVTANPNTENHLDESKLGYLDEVWRDGWDEELGTIPARVVTDRAIATAREQQPERMIVHYMQPHPPFVPNQEIDAMHVTADGQELKGKNVRDLVRAGYSKDELWQAHLENLQYVLEDVELLRENVDADQFVISADHGQAFGEWGVYGHPSGIPIGALKTVPWVVTTATDSGEYVPEETDPDERPDVKSAVSEKLEALGYKE